jgi:general secretion pathway protein G
LLEQPDDEELEDKWAGPYVKPEQLKDPWGSDFVYRFPGEVNEGSFDIVSPGPDRDEGDDDDIGNYESVK